MTDADDPLTLFLQDQVERIEREVDDLLGAPGLSSGRRRWSYRFTWQEVERARRYRQPLPNDVAVAARRSAMTGSSTAQSGSDLRRDVQIRYRAGLNAYQVTVTASRSE